VLKKDPFKGYEILEIVPFPAIATQQKDPANTNVEVLKMRINEIYRDMRSRNTATKTNAQRYLARYNSDKGECKKEYQ
jgi:proline dehydrogenase